MFKRTYMRCYKYKILSVKGGGPKSNTNSNRRDHWHIALCYLRNQKRTIYIHNYLFMCTWLIADSGNRSGDGGECKKLDWKWNRKGLIAKFCLVTNLIIPSIV